MAPQGVYTRRLRMQLPLPPGLLTNDKLTLLPLPPGLLTLNLNEVLGRGVVGPLFGAVHSVFIVTRPGSNLDSSTHLGRRL